jgi:hypothetical protein
MTTELQIGLISISIFLGLLSLGLVMSTRKKQKDQREQLEFAEKQIEDLHEIIARTRESADLNTQRLAEHVRRIAWLESRIRKPQPLSEDVIDDGAEETEPEKLSITERRHRVISLASRGQRAETIAATLGMLPGEVELIISLNQAAWSK